MDDRLFYVAELIIEMATITPAGWMALAAGVSKKDIPATKHKMIERLFEMADATERLTTLTLLMMMEQGRISDAFISEAVKRGSLPAILALAIMA